MEMNIMDKPKNREKIQTSISPRFSQGTFHQGNIKILGSFWLPILGKRKIILGPGKQPLFVLLVIFCISLIAFFQIRETWPKETGNIVIPTYYHWLSWIQLFCIVVLLLNFLIVSFTSPGYNSPNNKAELKEDRLGLNESQEEQSTIFCDICGISKDQARKTNIVHCPTCDLCIEGYDHHCMLLANCIGEKTIFFFNSLMVTVIVNGVFCYVMIFICILGGYSSSDQFSMLQMFGMSSLNTLGKHTRIPKNSPSS